MSTEHNMTTLLQRKSLKNIINHFKTAHIKLIFVCVLSSSVRPTALSLNRTVGVTYCL